MSGDLPVVRWVRELLTRRNVNRVRAELDAARERAETATPSYRPQYYLKAARLAASLDLESEALSLYGSAIDGYLEAGRGRAAEVVCRQVIETYPQVVRARRTLALMALGRGEMDRAATLLHEYAETARTFGDAGLMRESLRAMGLISSPGAARDQAADELRALGDEAGARMVEQGDDLSQDEVFGRAAHSWAKALQAALMGADELRRLRST